MAEHNDLGRQGEDMAVTMLIGKGYRILDRNWRFGKLELDIVASYGNEIVFVEVKTRRNDLFASPRDAITTTKVKNIVRAADSYIKEHGIDLDARFDIIEIVGTGPSASIEHTESAFVPPIM